MKTVSKIKNALLYAQALYDGAERTKEAQLAYADAQHLQALSAEDLALLEHLNTPLGQMSDKLSIIDALAQKMSLCNSVRNTLKILTQNRKLNLLSLIMAQFIVLYQQKHDIAEVEVRTVMALSESQDRLLKEKLSALLHKKILVNYVIDAHIIGGLVIRYGTNFIDNSIQHKLNALDQLMKGIK